MSRSVAHSVVPFIKKNVHKSEVLNFWSWNLTLRSSSIPFLSNVSLLSRSIAIFNCIAVLGWVAVSLNFSISFLPFLSMIFEPSTSSDPTLHISLTFDSFYLKSINFIIFADDIFLLLHIVLLQSLNLFN